MTTPSGKVNALIGSFSKGNAPPIKTGPMPTTPGRKLTKEVPVVEEDPNLTEEEKLLKKKGFNTDSLNAGSLHRRRKANSKLALDKVNKNFAGNTDSIEIDSKGQSLGGQSTFGKSTIKKLGFQMAKSSQLNFYDKWKTDDYPDTVVHIFETLMKSVGVGGVPKPDEEDWVGDFMEKLHTKLAVQSQHNYGVIPKNYRKLMPSMFEESQALLERQKKLERIVKIQSVYRGYFARKELKEWLAEPDVKLTKSKRHQCNLAFRDLLKAETDYNNDLKSAVENFLWPLRQLSTESSKKNSTIDLSFWTSGTPPVILSKDDIDAIFSNMEILLATHQRILKKLLQLRESWPFFDNVGEVFLKLAPQLIPYGDYVANSKHALDTLVRLQNSDPKFNAFLTAMSQNEKDLMGYLVRPLNHITQYALYLKLVKRNTPPEDPGMEHLRNAYLAIKKTKQFIQEYYETAGNRAKIAEIQRHLISPRNTPYELTRKTFLQQGHVTISEKGIVMTSDKKKSFYLLNDLLLLCDDGGKKVTHEFPLKEIQFENENVIYNGQKTVFAEKSEIVKKIKEINDTLTNSHKVFGLPLQKLLEREKPADGIPYIVKCCVDFLKKKREMEGIFRISGGTAEVAALKEMFNKAEGNPINLNGQNPYAVAAILKMYFRELPEPIFTFNAFKPLASVSLSDEEDSATSIKQIKTIVETLPPANLNLIKYLFSFVLSVAKLGTVNKMTASNLAIVFGPNLLYPQEETLETIMLIPKMNALFLFMFDQYTEIFGEKIDMK